MQQILDGLEAEGIVERIADPADGRGKFVRYTGEGLRALRDGDRVKREIEQRYVAAIGAERFAALMDALRALDQAAIGSLPEASRIRIAKGRANPLRRLISFSKRPP